MPDPRSAPVTVPSVRAAKRRDGHPPLVMVTAYDAPGARIADAAGVDIILVGDSVANNVLGLRGQPAGDRRGHGPPHRGGGPGQAAAPRRGRPALDELPPRPRGHRAQRRRPDPGRRPGGQAGGRGQPGADDRGAGRRRDPGDGPSGPHPAVGQRDGRLPGPGPGRGRRPLAGRRGQGHRGRRLLRRGAGGGPRIGRCGHHRVARRPHHRDRRRARTATARCWSSTTCSGFNARVPKFVRRYAELGEAATAAVAAYAADVRSGAFPADAEVYH